MTALLVVFLGLLGLAIGSFLNVVIWRLPRAESIVRPRSHCPHCEAPVRPRDEVPVLSWLLLHRKCRDCGAAISARYPLVEAGTGVLFALMAARFAQSTPRFESPRVLPAFLYLCAVGVTLAMIDLDTKRLPDKLTLPSYPVAAVLLGAATVAGAGSRPLARAALGAAAMFAVYFALWFAVPGGMGYGDVKLSGVLGAYLAWLGWDIWSIGLLLGWILGGVVGIALTALGRAGRKTRVPFGPFMIGGALLAILAGGSISGLWLGT